MADKQPTFSNEELQSEKWREIPEYEGYYEASTLGHRAVLTAEKVLRIRAFPSSVGSTTIARELGVSRGAICGARKGITWKHLPIPPFPSSKVET